MNALLAANQQVRGWTRNASSTASQALSARGVRMYEGSFSEHAALTTAALGCAGVFMNLMPSFTSPTAEGEEGGAIVAAAKAARVKHLIYSTVSGVEIEDIMDYVEPESIKGWYYRNKRALEEETRSGGFEYWTIFRPATFMTNFLGESAAFMYPDLAKGVLKMALKEETKNWLIAPKDIGTFVAAAFLDPEWFHGKHVPLAAEVRSTASIVEEIEKVSGKKVALERYTPEEIKQSVIADAQDISNKVALSVDIDQVKSWGIPLQGFNEFLHEHKEILDQTIGPN